MCHTNDNMLGVFNSSRSASPVGDRCHFVLLDKDESCPTADLSNIGRHNGPGYSSTELLNTTLITEFARQIVNNELTTVQGKTGRAEGHAE